MPSTSQNTSSFLYVTQACLPTHLPTHSLESAVTLIRVIHIFMSIPPLCNPYSYILASSWIAAKETGQMLNRPVLCDLLLLGRTDTFLPNAGQSCIKLEMLASMQAHLESRMNCVGLLASAVSSALAGSAQQLREAGITLCSPCPIPKHRHACRRQRNRQLICQNADALRHCFKPDCC